MAGGGFSAGLAGLSAAYPAYVQGQSEVNTILKNKALDMAAANALSQVLGGTSLGMPQPQTQQPPPDTPSQPGPPSGPQPYTGSASPAAPPMFRGGITQGPPQAPTPQQAPPSQPPGAPNTYGPFQPPGGGVPFGQRWGALNDRPGAMTPGAPPGPPGPPQQVGPPRQPPMAGSPRHGRGRKAAGGWRRIPRRPTRTARGAHASVLYSKVAASSAAESPAQPAGAFHPRAEADRANAPARRA